MKKLMFAVAACALAGVASAAEGSINPYVYDMTMTFKTSTCNKKGEMMVKVTKNCDDLDGFIYRQQVTLKFAGAFWGCGCDVIANPTWNANVAAGDMTDPADGFLFWDATDKVLFADYDKNGPTSVCVDQAFAWDILNVIGRSAGKVEGLFQFAIGEDISITGAGYGNAKIYDFGDCDAMISEEIPVPTSDFNYIKSMKGYLVGSWTPGDLVITVPGSTIGCYYCGGNTEPTETSCQAYTFCTACGPTETGKAPIYGTWTLALNQSATKKIGGSAKKSGVSVFAADSKIPNWVKKDLAKIAAIED